MLPPSGQNTIAYLPGEQSQGCSMDRWKCCEAIEDTKMASSVVIYHHKDPVYFLDQKQYQKGTSLHNSRANEIRMSG